MEIDASDQTRLSKTPTPPNKRQLALALLMVGAFCAGMGQTIVFSVVPPIARQIGLSDFLVGFIFSGSAALWVLTAPRWGRVSDQRGRKPMILIGMSGFVFSMLFFGLVWELGIAGVVRGWPLFVLLALTRAIYGAIGSAGPPSAQAYIADRTTKANRTAGMAGYSASFGIGSVLGPGFGAMVSVLSPAAPFFAMAVIGALMGGAVLFFLQESTPPKERQKPKRIHFYDKRIRAFLVIGFLFGLINAVPLQTIGFYFIDRLGFSLEVAPQMVGVGLMANAMASLFSQLVIVQRFKLPPKHLLRIAPILILCGHSLIFLSSQMGPVIFGLMLGGFGVGLGLPGYNAATSIAVEPEEQGGAIGLSHSMMAAGFIFSPMIAFSLYPIAPQLPYVFTVSLACVIALVAFTTESVRNAVPDEDGEIEEREDDAPASAPYR